MKTPDSCAAYPAPLIEAADDCVDSLGRQRLASDHLAITYRVPSEDPSNTYPTPSEHLLNMRRMRENRASTGTGGQSALPRPILRRF